MFQLVLAPHSLFPDFLFQGYQEKNKFIAAQGIVLMLVREAQFIGVN